MSEIPASVYVLTTPLMAEGLHGLTGQPYVHGELPTGTLIRNLRGPYELDEDEEGNVVKAWRFEASSDGGRCWYINRTYSAPSTLGPLVVPQDIA